MPGLLTDDIRKDPPPPPTGEGWGGGGEPDGRGASRRASFMALLWLLAATTMVFAAFICAFLFRRGLSGDWASVPKPAILWLNTAVLLASSGVLEVARRALKSGDRERFNTWWTFGAALGILFLLGQAVAWHRLSQAGVLVATSPSSSFFYVLTAAHALHLVGGVSALVWLDVQALRHRLGPAKRTAVDISAYFWHFLDGLWVCLMALFYLFG